MFRRLNFVTSNNSLRSQWLNSPVAHAVAVGPDSVLGWDLEGVCGVGSQGPCQPFLGDENHCLLNEVFLTQAWPARAVPLLFAAATAVAAARAPGRAGDHACGTAP